MSAIHCLKKIAKVCLKALGTWALIVLIGFLIIDSKHIGFRNIVYCSPVEGRILMNGTPMEFVRVTRTLRSDGFWGDKNIDSAVTDAKGYYRLPEVSEWRFFRPDLLSSNPTVSIHFQADHKNTTYGLWFGYNPTYSLGAETNYPEIKIESELTDSEVGRYSVIVNSKVREIREEPPRCGSEDNPCN